MSRIEWEDSYSVNHTEIDAQHKKWFEMYNDMHKSFGKGGTKEYTAIAVETLKKMHDYCRHQFEFEEDYMRKVNYPDIVKHRRAHKDFDTLIYEYNRDIHEGRLVLNTTIISAIRNWILDHILVEDKKYRQFVSRKREPTE